MIEWIKAYLTIAYVIKLVKTHRFAGATLIGLSMFLWAFYCGIAERIFHSNKLVNSTEIINTLAFRDAIWYNGAFVGDLAILFFPFLFFGISILIHNPTVKKRFIYFSVIFGVLLDITIALVSSNNIHHFREANEENYSGSWSIIFGGVDYIGHVIIVILCGMCGIIVLGGVYEVVRLQSNDESNLSSIKSHVGVGANVEENTDIIEEG